MAISKRREKTAGMVRRATGAILAMTIGASLATMPAGASPLEDGAAAFAKKQYTEAYRILKPLAQAGDPEAQYMIGRLFESGYGAEQSYAEAAAWYRRAAERGNARAEHALSVFYAVGWGVEQDLRESVAWLRLSAEQGYYYAQSDLGSRYAAGRGVSRDDVLAYMWLEAAVSEAPSEVRPALVGARDAVAARLDAEALERARKLAEACLRSRFRGCG